LFLHTATCRKEDKAMATATILGSVKNHLKRGKLQKMVLFLASGDAIKAGYANFPEKEAGELLAADPTLTIKRTDVTAPAGQVALALTPAGVAAAAQLAAQPAAPAAAQSTTPAEKPEFKIESGIELPARKRGNVGAAVYPFDKLTEVGQSFFIPSTEKRPNPAKAMASTVSSASRRYKGQTPERKFTIREVEGGARIWRTV
jgi:hypothetical protein